MAELTIEQRRALALAAARKRMQDGAEKPSAMVDSAKSFGSGLARGAAEVVGWPGTISDLADSGLGWMLKKGYQTATGREPTMQGGPVERFFAPNPEKPKSPLSGNVARTALAAASGGASEYQPQTTAGKYAGTVGEFLPGAAAFGGMSPSNLTRFGVLPALGSEAAGQVTEGTAAEPYARVAGAMLAPAAPALAKRAITPLPIDATRQKMVDVLSREGVPITAGQKTGRQSLRYAESELGGGAAANFAEKQGEAFTSAALKKAGINASRATPDVMNSAFSRIGQQFDDLAARNSITPDRQLVTDMGDVLRNYRDLGGEAPAIEKAIETVVRSSQSGSVPGDVYKAVHSRLFRVSRSSDPELKMAALDLRNVLDDAMERSMQAKGSADLGAWQEARRQYKNMLVLEKAASGAGESAAQGILTPSQLRNATVNQGRRQYVRGQGDFADLARAGEAIMKPLPQSGTAPRTAARNLGVGLSGAIGAGAGATVGPATAIAGALAGSVAPYAIGRAMLSKPGRAYLGNQLVSPSKVLDPRYAAVIESLLGQRALTDSRAQ